MEINFTIIIAHAWYLPSTLAFNTIVCPSVILTSPGITVNVGGELALQKKSSITQSIVKLRTGMVRGGIQNIKRFFWFRFMEHNMKKAQKITFPLGVPKQQNLPESSPSRWRSLSWRQCPVRLSSGARNNRCRPWSCAEPPTSRSQNRGKDRHHYRNVEESHPCIAQPLAPDFLT